MKREVQNLYVCKTTLGFTDFFSVVFLNFYFISSLIFIISVLLTLGFFVLLFLILLGGR